MPNQKLLAKIHCVKRDLGLDEETYRQALANATGKRSAANMTDRELVKAIRRLTSAGRDPYAASPEIIWKIKNMWHDLYRGTEETKHLRQWLFNHFRVSDVNFLDKRKAYDAVEALKAMSRRIQNPGVRIQKESNAQT